MINIKALTIATTLTIGSIMGAVTPASAGTCWKWTPNSSYRAKSEYCRLSRRVNNNGHTVIDIDNGSIVLWTDGTAEVLHNNIPYSNRWFTWEIDGYGDYKLAGAPGYSFSFRF